MNISNQKVVIRIEDSEYLNWKSCLKNKIRMHRSINIEIDSKNLDFSCTDISEIITIANQYDCKVICFCSTSLKTVISSQSLGYRCNFIIEDSPNMSLKIHDKDSTFSPTHFHQGTLRSGEYLDCPGDLLILGDVNPGAKVSAEGNIIIWGRLLGIAHAGSSGNSKATISALQLRPLQLRIAKKIARGPKEKPQRAIAEQARIYFEEIVISPLETI